MDLSVKKMKPLISILTPVYNHEKFIGDTIDSVINQTYKNWEMLVVDDCSTDGSWNIIQEYAKKDSRIKVFRNETNKGLIPNWKFLIDNSNGKYIAFLEGDDVFYSHNLEEKNKIFEKYPEVGMVYCNFDIINEKGDFLIKNYYKKDKIKTFKNEKIKPEEFLFSRALPFSTYSQIMLKRDVLSISGYPRSFDYESKVFIPSDWDFNFRVATKNNIYSIDDVLIGFRKHSGNNSANTIKACEQLTLVLDEYAKEFKDDKNVLSGIRYMRGKAMYFNIIYYLENNQKREAWKQFESYMIQYPRNLWRDFHLNFKLFIRLFLPNRINLFLRKIYFSN